MILGVVLPSIAQTGGGRDFMRNEYMDIALIYYGQKKYLSWNEQELTPYVTHKFADGHTDWLFPAFLYINLVDNNNALFTYNPHKNDVKYARQAEWQWYLNRLFETNSGLYSLNNCIEQNKRLLGTPKFRHKIIITIPYPIIGQNDWGKINNRKLNLKNNDSRMKAIKWFVQSFIDRFNKAGLNNIELEGFYWLPEAIRYDDDMTIIPQVSDYLHSLGYKFYWIPYYGAMKATAWAKYGFDYAYFQTGYCLNANTTEQQFIDRVTKGKKASMGMELEFSEKYFQKPDPFAQRLEYLIDYYEKNGLFENCAMTYFLGHKVLIEFNHSKSAAAHRLIDRLAGHIVARQPFNNKAYTSPTLAPGTGDNNKVDDNNNNTNNTTRRRLVPEDWHF